MSPALPESLQSQLDAARRLGAIAGMPPEPAGKHTCPYKPDDGPLGKMLTLAWIRGYNGWDPQPASVDYEG